MVLIELLDAHANHDDIFKLLFSFMQSFSNEDDSSTMYF